MLTEKKHVPRTNRRKLKHHLEEDFGKIQYPLSQSLPKVPSTDGLNTSGGQPEISEEIIHLTSNPDIQNASLFAQHRPISLSTPIPSESSPSDFASLFESKSQRKTSAAEVIVTLNSVLRDLEQAASAPQPTSEEPDVRTTATHALTSTTDREPEHLDLPAKNFHISLQELSEKFIPFMPPPPPVPLAATQEAAQQSAKEVRRELPAKRRTYTTTLTVYESTHRNGKTTYETHSTPLVVEEHRPLVLLEPSELPSGHQDNEYSEPAHSRLEFLERMRDRRMRYEIRVDKRYSGKEIMHAISVKRQRKLKMKKHKYKKLMKRTKNLRRRLDRT